MIRKPKEKILVSFSGGETSAYMINWLLKNKPDHDYKFVFANTGEENEETLIFVQKCAEFFNIDITWVEYDENIRLFSDYLSNEWITSPIKSLYSLIKSKGWFTSNPYKKPEHYDLWAKYGDFTQYGKSLTESVQQWQEAESRTLHNPVIFKIALDKV